jgi:flavin reductase (DIM6/NTAB) family NADH-FMN oxidoreductase RutF
MSDLVSLELDESLWDHVFQVAPLVLVGTREPDGAFDLAPKHRAVTLSPTHFGFVCRASHATFRNAVREKAFTVSWPGPRHIVMTAAAASPRCVDGEKPVMSALPTVPATEIDGVFLEGCALQVECRLDRVIDDLGEDSLVIGRIVAAFAAEDALRGGILPDGEVMHEHPLLAYLHPTRYATIETSIGFPFPKGFVRD